VYRVWSCCACRDGEMGGLQVELAWKKPMVAAGEVGLR